MPALTESIHTITEFAGDYKVAVVKLDMATGTTGTVTIDELSIIVGVVASLSETPTTTCCGVTASCTTNTNVVTVIATQQTGLPCLTAALDCTIIAVGY